MKATIYCTCLEQGTKKVAGTIELHLDEAMTALDIKQRCAHFARSFADAFGVQDVSVSIESEDDRVKKSQASLAGEKAGIHPQDRKLTERARNLLVNNMGKPLSLEKLAENVGMSHPKLNSCFKQLYGMTVFQYLRATRLSRARYLLHVEGLSVTEVAYEVGYDSLSHFSQVYKKNFGMLPSSSRVVKDEKSLGSFHGKSCQKV